MADLRWLISDNPMLWRFFRSKLRRRQLIPGILTMVTLGVAAAWAGREFNWISGGQSINMLIGLQAVLLLFIGSTQIGQQAGKARTSGMLDFHRISPLPPLNLALGFLLGAPILQYVLAGVILPFAIFCAYGSPIGVSGYLLILIPLLLGVWIANAMTLLNTLIGKAGGGAARSIIVAVFLFYAVGGGIGGLVGFRSNFFAGELPKLQFFGVPLPALVLIMGYQIAILCFFLVGTVRKMISDRTHAYSKSQAIGFLSLLGVLGLGGCWTLVGFDYLALIVLYAMIIAAIILLITITPDLAGYLKGLEFAERHGRRRPTWRSDAGLNRMSVGIMGVIVLVVSTVAWNQIESRTVIRDTTAYSLTIAIGVFVVAYFGLGLQWFLLVSRKGGTTMFALFLMVVWIGPIVTGSIMAALGVERWIMLPTLAISPWPGLALSAHINRTDLDSYEACRIATLIPAMFFAFGFNNLISITRRKVEHRRDLLLEKDVKPKATEPEIVG